MTDVTSLFLAMAHDLGIVRGGDQDDRLCLSDDDKQTIKGLLGESNIALEVKHTNNEINSILRLDTLLKVLRNNGGLYSTVSFEYLGTKVFIDCIAKDDDNNLCIRLH